MKTGLRYWWPVPIVVAALIAATGFVGVAWWCQADAHRAGADAVRAVGGDEVTALGRIVESSRLPLGERNRAVWALGQLGDSRALPILARFYTGAECDHGRQLCQKELRKAIDRCNGKNWAPAWVPYLPHQPG